MRFLKDSKIKTAGLFSKYDQPDGRIVIFVPKTKLVTFENTQASPLG